ncbi:dynamin family protein [Rummeliibacillus suwonensis]|uniref:dynamin family protein n=1 Tax=Rummeliibacillus suwonensis TaxID=1306154 RepID=UPI001AAFD068|nr:dynamin family protein [Rummeliibacillus suwonensis]MBO2535937.1 dynamin family protein [Rummeliibacillus suwonensis]
MDKDLMTVNDLKEELPVVRWEYEKPAEFLQKFVVKLRYLNKLLSKNSYVRETTKILKYIIQDATNNTIVLFAGMTDSGKTSLVNALLKRPILSTNVAVATEVNTIICYGEKEKVCAHFLDGQIASFDIHQVELFTSLETSSAKILRDSLDFIEIYVQNDLLKMVTLIDTTPLQISGNDTAYIKESILNRADDIFWIFKYGLPIVPEELKLLEKIKGKNIIPLGILNGLDLIDLNHKDSISSYEEQVSSYVRDLICISSKEALESVSLKDDNDEKWRHSQIDLVIKELEKTANNQAKRLAYLTERFIHWLKRFQTEIEIIPEREPYQTSFLTLKEYVEHFEERQAIEAAQNSYTLELSVKYEKQSTIFKKVDTLFQLIQVIESKPFCDNTQLFTFNNQAKQYLLRVREYRKLRQEYTHIYELLDKKHQKVNGLTLLKFIFGKRQENEYFVDQIEKLNERQQILEKKYHLLKIEEKNLLKSFEKTKDLLNKVVQEQLAMILKDFSTIEFQRNTENAKIQTAIKKLKGFDSIVEAQSFILKFVSDYVLKEGYILTKEEKTKLQEMLQAIEKTVFDYPAYIEQYEQMGPINNVEIQKMIIEKNPFYSCHITEDHIRVQLDEPPKILNLDEE